MTLRSRVFTAALVLAVQAGCTASSGIPSGGSQASSSAPSSPSGSPASQEPTPFATTLGGVPEVGISLGRGAAPIDVVAAFGSLWVAGHHSDDIIRIDPVSLRIVARIQTGAGPGWFAVTDDAVWVTNQNGAGLSRIDPDKNALAASVGTEAPCGPPAFAFDSVWVLECDAGVIERFDAATNRSIASIPAPGYSEPFLAQSQLFTANSEALARIDPTTNSLVVIGGCCGGPFGFDGATIWLNGPNALTRVDPENGQVIATIEGGSGATTMAIENGHAWIAYGSRHQLVEIDVATSQEIRTIDVGTAATKVLWAFESLWVTDFETSRLWRITP